MSPTELVGFRFSQRAARCGEGCQLPPLVRRRGLRFRWHRGCSRRRFGGHLLGRRDQLRALRSIPDLTKCLYQPPTFVG